MEIFGIVLIIIGVFIGTFSKLVIFKSLERQLENINLQYNDIAKTEDETDEDFETDDDFLPILKIVKLITYFLSTLLIIFGFLMILIFKLYS